MERAGRNTLTTIDVIDNMSGTSIDIDLTFCSKGKNKMKDSYGDYVLMLKTISEETRLKIIDMLSCGELCACDILEKLSISQSTLSYHMNLLTKSGLVDGRKDGPWMKYTLNQSKISELKAFLAMITTAKTDCICK